MQNGADQQGCNYSNPLAELVKLLREDDKIFSLRNEPLACGVKVGMSLRQPDEEGHLLFMTLDEETENHENTRRNET